MAIAVGSQGGALVRVDPAQSDALVATTKAAPMHMHSRNCADGCRSASAIYADDQLAPWVEIGTGYSRSLPPECPGALIVLTRRCVVGWSGSVDDDRRGR
jgi:hypothetical protein